ncbi:WGR domain-containing protein [Metasolibacillus sp.]|uniref:WGR domain-containing protein n=1 Tax=Metasolibacillus sp. TaxID=2703680 RepID=UPI0025FE319F|nr:WGR domain-containing protein [Metasolibacillus sp.]MCT6922887.1 WGR domain-containing protein [Metasolibacillus sp.]MCT6939125.1 WGR domain-containing protein [Metasolibacillus sp.]
MSPIRRAFIYQDEKSHKFWTIDYSDIAIGVHYGKSGTIGKYEVKEYASLEACEKEAKKLIANKVKKGYKEAETFDFESCFYIDTVEYGPHPKTSHPRFVAHFTEDFYYDCGDEEAPFGSDEGSDTLSEVEEMIRKKRPIAFSTLPQYIVEQLWGMQYIAVTTLDKEEVEQMKQKQEIDMQQSDMVTYSSAFAQIKITGQLDPKLKNKALLALKRFAIMYTASAFTETQQTMYEGLLAFEATVEESL